MNRIRIAELILSYRRKHGINQGEFGKKLGVSAQAVSKWETEKAYPDITLLPLLAKLLDVSIKDLFED